MTYSSLSTAVIIVCVIAPVLAAVAVGLRFQVRRLKRQTPFLDDYLMLVSLVRKIEIHVV